MKVFGCFLVLISSVCCAYFYEKSLKASLLKYAEIIEFIKYTKSQIEYFSTPIDKIFTSFESKYINEAIKSKSASRNLIKDYARLNEFFSTIGKGYKKEESDLCDYYISYFQDEYSKIANELPIKIKVSRAMSLFIGATLIIFLV